MATPTGAWMEEMASWLTPGSPKPLVYRGRLGPRADNAHIGSGLPQNLLLHGEVVGVAVGHNHRIVLRLHCDIAADGGKVSTDKPLRIRKPFRRHQISPVVKHRHPEADGFEYRAQGQRAVPRPEENGPLPHGNGQGKYLRRPAAAPL